ncbi:MAG: hypothetical protein ABJA84_11850, partial [Polaromonas sp.]
QCAAACDAGAGGRRGLNILVIASAARRSSVDEAQNQGLPRCARDDGLGMEGVTLFVTTQLPGSSSFSLLSLRT